MRRLTVLLASALLLAGCAAPAHVDRDVPALQNSRLYTFNEHEIDRYLGWLSAQELTTPQRVARVARQTIGQPYRLGLLGEFPFELYDPDPLYCLSASDCVTFVEQTYALAISNDWPSFMRNLMHLRYRDGVIGLRTRNHFMEADWNANNAWLFDDVTAALGDDVATRLLRCRGDRAALFAKHGLTCDVPVEIVEDRYVPREALAAALPRMQDGDIIEIVKGNAEWQYVSHVGLALHDPAGRVTMIHATKPAVREEAFEEYLARHPDVLGLKLLRPMSPRPQSAAGRLIDEMARRPTLDR